MWTSALLQQHGAGGGDDNDAEVAPPAANHYLEFSLLLYRWETNSVSSNSPPGCILTHWAQFDPLTLKKQRLIFCCNTEWPLYKLPNGGTWPINRSLNNNTILQLDLFFPNTRVNGQRCLMLRSSFYSKKIIPLQKCKLATVAFYLILARQPLLSLLWLNSLNSQLLLLLLLATVPSIYPKLPQYPGRSPPPSKSSSISLEKVCLLVET